MFIYFWERQRQNASRLGAEREGHTESEAGSRLWAVSTEPNAGLEITNCEILTWAKVRCLTNWATQVPLNIPIKKNFFNVYLFLRETETECKCVRGRERGRHRIQSRLQALSCQHRAQCRAWNHELWDHDLSWSQMFSGLSHPGAPHSSLLKRRIHIDSDKSP